jgi:hypothetical protein
LKKGTDNAKKEYLGNKCNEIIEFQSTGHYDLMYIKTKGPGWKEKHRIQNIYIEDSKVNTIVYRRQELKIWENYITELYNQTNRSENLEVKPQEEADTDKKGPFIFHVKWKLSRSLGIKQLQEMMMYLGR